MSTLKRRLREWFLWRLLTPEERVLLANQAIKKHMEEHQRIWAEQLNERIRSMS